MKFTKLFMLVAGLCMTLAGGCATNAPPLDEPIASTAESVSSLASDPAASGSEGAALENCTGWTLCYRVCGRRFPCDWTNPTVCDRLADCLDDCDASFPGAASSCPYPF